MQYSDNVAGNFGYKIYAFNLIGRQRSDSGRHTVTATYRFVQAWGVLVRRRLGKRESLPPKALLENADIWISLRWSDVRELVST